MELIEQHKCRRKAMLSLTPVRLLLLAFLTLSPAKHLPLASFEHHLLLSLLTFSLTIG
jgi:hypothetical protein